MPGPSTKMAPPVFACRHRDEARDEGDPEDLPSEMSLRILDDVLKNCCFIPKMGFEARCGVGHSHAYAGCVACADVEALWLYM